VNESQASHLKSFLDRNTKARTTTKEIKKFKIKSPEKKFVFLFNRLNITWLTRVTTNTIDVNLTYWFFKLNSPFVLGKNTL